MFVQMYVFSGALLQLSKVTVAWSIKWELHFITWLLHILKTHSGMRMKGCLFNIITTATHPIYYIQA